MGRMIPSGTITKGRVLLVEDDTVVRHGFALALRSKGYEVIEAESKSEALHHLTARPDVVITDLRLPDGDAVSFLPQLREIDATVPVYIITGFATIDVAVRAVKLGAEDFFTKPVELTTLIGCVEAAVARGSASRVSQSAAQPSPTITPRSSTMRRLEEEIARLRNSDCTVLILGETGTGKSVLARRIHDLGARKTGPFVDVNCAGLSKEFVESELFGHVRGAFTGAHAPKQGLFDAANDGTLFLDEIGDIDMQVQPKVLKVLEEKRYRRMGDVRERDADVRLLSATHHDLLAAVEQKSFRADLFYRISTVTLRVPSLRERAEDIPVLVDQILAQQSCPEVTISRGAWDKIASYLWPGNIRELKNVLHRALILRKGDTVSADDVRFDSDPRYSSGNIEAVRPPEPSSSQTLEQVEREHITRALAAENGRVSDAARRLGVPRSTLYQKIKNYRIPLRARARGSVPPSQNGH